MLPSTGSTNAILKWFQYFKNLKEICLDKESLLYQYILHSHIQVKTWALLQSQISFLLLCVPHQSVTNSYWFNPLNTPISMSSILITIATVLFKVVIPGPFAITSCLISLYLQDFSFWTDHQSLDWNPSKPNSIKKLKVFHVACTSVCILYLISHHYLYFISTRPNNTLEAPNMPGHH